MKNKEIIITKKKNPLPGKQGLTSVNKRDIACVRASPYWVFWTVTRQVVASFILHFSFCHMANYNDKIIRNSGRFWGWAAGGQAGYHTKVYKCGHGYGKIRKIRRNIADR